MFPIGSNYSPDRFTGNNIFLKAGLGGSSRVDPMDLDTTWTLDA